MPQLNHIDFFKGFALIPFKTRDTGWTWMKTIYIIEDNRPIEYLGLLSRKYRFLNEKKAEKFYFDLIEEIKNLKT